MPSSYKISSKLEVFCPPLIPLISLESKFHVAHCLLRKILHQNKPLVCKMIEQQQKTDIKMGLNNNNNNLQSIDLTALPQLKRHIT